MKKIFLVSILMIHSVLSFAQMKGQGQGQTQMSVPKFNAEKAAGILKYDEDKVHKKLNIKDTSTKQNVSKLLADYNKGIEELMFLNAPKFKKIEQEVNTQREIAMANRDRQAMMGIMEGAREKLAPVKKKVIEANKILNQELEKILTEKQYKKWIKYQASKKRALKPKSPSGNSNMSRGQGQGRHGGGGGKIGY